MSMGIKIASGGGSMPGMGSIRAVPQGNGYMGDPGIFGTLWGGIKGAVGGLVTGGPLGMIGGAIGGALGEKGSVMTATPRSPFLPTIPISRAAPLLNFPNVQATNGARPPQVPRAGAGAWVERALPGGQTGMMDDPSYRAGKASSMGYHWNKSGYFLQSGEWIAKGTKQVKNRRRNPLNPRALDRSISRITSAKRASKKLSRVTIRKATSCK